MTIQINPLPTRSLIQGYNWEEPKKAFARSISLFSFFSGAGFLDLGFETSGFKIEYINEFNPEFLRAYHLARKPLGIPLPQYGFYGGSITDFLETEQKKYITSLVKEAHKKADLVGFIGGPPCPDFSVAGKNKGSEGENGKLSLNYIKLICEQSPDFFLFENVKGLWRNVKHRNFYNSLKKNLNEAGYILTERLINAIEFGVPQDRERIILIGFKAHLTSDLGISLPKNTEMLPQDVFPWNKYIKYPAKDVFSLPWPSSDIFNIDSEMQRPIGIPEELTVDFWFQKNDVNNHPNAQHHFKPKAGLPRFNTVQEGDDSKKSYKRLHRWRYSPTAAYGNNEVHLHPYQARRISAAEALAIQSLPKNFSLPPSMTLTDMFKTIGNGVPYLASFALAQTLLSFLRGD